MTTNKQIFKNENISEQIEQYLSLLPTLKTSLSGNNKNLIIKIADELHPSDFAKLISQLSNDEQIELVKLIETEINGQVLVELDESVLLRILAHINYKNLAQKISYLETDDASYLLANLPNDLKDQILELIPAINRYAVKEVLDYDANSAGRLMQKHFFAAPSYWTVGQVIDTLRNAKDIPNRFFEVFIIDANYRPIGGVILSTLLKSKRQIMIEELSNDSTPTISVTIDKEEVAYIFKQYNLVSAPVVDDHFRLVGMITVDDVVDVTSEESQEDLLALSGVNSNNANSWSIITVVKSRFTWLLLNLVTAITASIIISLFDVTLQSIVAVAILMPIVASMGGNVGTQTLAVAIRNLANKDLTTTNALRMIIHETYIGGINGLIFAIIISVLAFLWHYYLGNAGLNQSVLLAIAIAGAMIINLFAAGLSGIIIPLYLDRLGYDPAIASTVFVTTITDIVGFISFLGLATLLLF